MFESRGGQGPVSLPNVGLFMTSVLCFIFLSFPMTTSQLPKNVHVAESIWLFVPPLVHRNCDFFFCLKIPS